MKEENKHTALFDEYMESISGMREAETDPFFYTRLSAKMEKQNHWVFPLRPVWIVTGLVLLLLVNGFMTIDKFKTTEQINVAGTTALQSFATAYDLSVQSTY